MHKTGLLNSTPLASGVSISTREEMHIEALKEVDDYQVRVKILEKIGFYHNSEYSYEDYTLFSSLDLFANRDKTKYILMNDEGKVYKHEGVYAFDDISILIGIEGKNEHKVVYGFSSKNEGKYNIHIFSESSDSETGTSIIKNGFTEDGHFKTKDEMEQAFSLYVSPVVSSDVYNIITGELY